MLELETPLVESGPHYDTLAPEEMRLDKRKLTSGLVAPATNYAVGAIKGGALHLVPLKTTLQMRPDLSHVDGEDDAETAAARMPKLQQVGLRPWNREATSAPGSYAQKRATQESEAWRELEVHAADSETADRVRRKLLDGGSLAQQQPAPDVVTEE